MSEITVLEDYVNRAGMRVTHWVRVGEEIPAEDALGMIPAQERGSARLISWEDGERVVRHHMMAFRWARDAATLTSLTDYNRDEAIPAVVWRLGEGERMRDALQDAADTFWGYYGRHPHVAYVRKMPKNAPKKMRLAGVANGEAEVRLAAAAWVPRRCVVVV